MMNRYKITYKSKLILFGDNIFTEIMCGKNPKDAMYKYEHDTHSCGMHEIISVEEI